MCLNRSDNNIGLVLLPVSQGRGAQTYRMEHSVLEKLAGCNVLAERSFALCFEKSADARTKRSVLMIGRLLTSSSAGFDGLNSFATSSLITKPVITDIPALKTRDMLTD